MDSARLTYVAIASTNSLFEKFCEFVIIFGTPTVWLSSGFSRASRRTVTSPVHRIVDKGLWSFKGQSALLTDQRGHLLSTLGIVTRLRAVQNVVSNLCGILFATAGACALDAPAAPQIVAFTRAKDVLLGRCVVWSAMNGLAAMIARLFPACTAQTMIEHDRPLRQSVVRKFQNGGAGCGGPACRRVANPPKPCNQYSTMRNLAQGANT